MIKTPSRNSLENKIVFYGMILSLISIVLTTVTCYFVSYKLILSQFEHVNRIATGAAVEKTNTYLGEIARIINMSMKNEYFNNLINSDSSDAYQLVKAQKDYETFLKNLILYNDKIDALIMTDKNFAVTNASNAVGKEYSKYNSLEFTDKLNTLLSRNPGSQFFLDRYIENNYERIAIICPVFKSYGNDLQATVIVVLSGKLTQEIQFAGDNIFITDSAGNSAVVVQNKSSRESTDERFLFNNRLNFEGWTITNTFTFEKLQKSINDNLYLNIRLGVLCLLFSFILVFWVGRKIVLPIKSMEEQISKLNHGDIEIRPIKFIGRKIGFKLALLILYSIVVTVPAVFITGSSYLASRNTVENKIGSVFEYSGDILYQQMGFIFNNSSKVAVEISTVNEKIQKVLNDQKMPDVETKIQDELNNIIMSNNLFGRGIANISIYGTDYRLICSSTYGSPFMMRPSIKDDLGYVKEHFGEPLWRSYTELYFNTNGFRVGMQIRGVPDGVESGKLLGYILIDFRADEIQKMLSSFIQYSDVNVYLTDASGNEIFQNGNRSDAKNLLDILSGNSDPELDKERVSFRKDGNNYLMISKEFDENKWRLIFLLKNFNENRQILYYSIAVLIGLIVLSFIFSYGFSYVLSFNISALIKTVRKVKGGDLNVRFKSSARDEIGELGNSFNEMLDRLKQLIDEKYLSEVKVKDAEIKAKEYELNLLQAQINPHFLYNTLKTAQYMVFAKDPRAEKMIKLLIALFKTGITRGEKLVRLQQEIEHVKTYIDIQQMRFAGKFRVSYKISDELLNYSVLKLTLQPIVENAIYHGLEVMEGEGDLTIEVCEDNQMLKVIVSDNGIGMSEEKLMEIREQLASGVGGKSIGMINVHERIRLHFGDIYGIEVESAKGCGSTVTIHYPMVFQKDA